MELMWIQIFLLSLLAAISILDSLSFQFGFHTIVGIGFLAGLVVGDVTTGLFIGGTLQLLILGIGTYGGASIPDYASATIIATALVATSNGTLTPEVAITIAIPVGILLLNFDILARWTNTFIIDKIESDITNKKFSQAIKKNHLGIITWGLSRFLPVFIALVLGQQFVEQFIEWINTNIQWLMTGLTVAGGLLPAVGIAILLKFMPIKKYFHFAILGFILVAYLSVPITGVALCGLIASVILYNQTSKYEMKTNNSNQELTNDVEGIYEYDE
ncbi:MAG: PTS mannose/fructose/sorbose/N-acetylgalactosamine transporter subunit IIC [Mycoplasmatales bacterium]